MSDSSNLKQKAASGLFWSFVDLSGNYGVQFLVQVLLARVLLPEDFGLIGMITIFLAVSTAFIDSGFTQALIRERDVKREDYSTAFFFNLLMSCSLYVVLFFSAPIISNFFEESKLTAILRVASLVLIINSFGLIQRAILIRKIDFKTQAKLSLLSSVLSGIIAVCTANLGFGVWSLVVWNLGMQFFLSLFLSLSSKWIPSLKFNVASFKKLFRFGSRLLLSGLINIVYDNIYFVIIGRFFSSIELGYYTNAKKISDMTSQAISKVVSHVTYPVLCSVQSNQHALQNSLKKTIQATCFVNFPLMVILMTIANPLLLVLLGNKWRESIPYFQLLCLAGMLYPLHGMNLNILKVVGRSDLFLKLEIIKKAIFTLVIAIVLLLRLGIIGLIWGMVANSFIAYYVNALYSKKLISYSITDQIKDILPSFLLSFAMGVIVFIAGKLIPGGDLLQLLVQTLVGFVVYFGLSKLFKIKGFAIAKDLALSFTNKIRRLQKQ